MTRRHAQIIAAMKAGCRLWRYSTADTGYLIVKESGRPYGPETVRKVTINAMIDAGLIEVDMKESYFRDSGGSDEVYKLVESHEQTENTQRTEA